VSAAASRDKYTTRRRRRLRTDYRTRTGPRSDHLREERDVHRFVDGTLRAWLEVILWLWIIVDDQTVADVASPTTVWSDGFRRATEPLVEHFLDRMAFRPQVVDFAALAMVVGATRGCAPAQTRQAPSAAITSTMVRGTV